MMRFDMASPKPVPPFLRVMLYDFILLDLNLPAAEGAFGLGASPSDVTTTNVPPTFNY